MPRWMPLVVALEALPPRRLGKLRRNAAVSPSSRLVKGICSEIFEKVVDRVGNEVSDASKVKG